MQNAQCTDHSVLGKQQPSRQHLTHEQKMNLVEKRHICRTVGLLWLFRRFSSQTEEASQGDGWVECTPEL